MLFLKLLIWVSVWVGFRFCIFMFHELACILIVCWSVILGPFFYLLYLHWWVCSFPDRLIYSRQAIISHLLLSLESLWCQWCMHWQCHCISRIFLNPIIPSLFLNSIYPGGGKFAPPWFLRVLGGCGFNFWWQPHILLRLTPDKRIYNFRIPRTTPTHGLKKWLFEGVCGS